MTLCKHNEIQFGWVFMGDYAYHLWCWPYTWDWWVKRGPDRFFYEFQVEGWK